MLHRVRAMLSLQLRVVFRIPSASGAYHVKRPSA